MKKLALSIAVSAAALAAAGAQAETSVDISGDAEFVAAKKLGSEDMTYYVDDADVNFNITDTLDNGAEVFAVIKTTFDDEDETGSPSYLDKAYLGYTTGAVTVSVGRQVYASDDFGIGEDKAFGTDNEIDATDNQDDIVKVAYAADTFTAKASVDLPESDAEEAVFSLYGDTTVSDFTVAGTFTTSDGESEFGVSAGYALDAFTVAAAYSYASFSEDSAVEFAGTYAASDALTVAAGLGIVIPDSGDNQMKFYGNATYALSDATSLWVELAGANEEAVADDNFAYAAGMSVEF